jgi:hypothetical protein
MGENIRQVHAVTYEGFVTKRIEEPDDESLDQFIRHLAAYEVDREGEWRVYWPKPGGPWFVADGLSERAARIVERLLNDPRFIPSVSQGLTHTPVEGAVAEASKPQRRVGDDWNFNLSSLVRKSDRISDGRVTAWMVFSPEARAVRARVYEDQAEPDIRTVFVDSVD